MKLKSKSVGDDSIPVPNRLYFRIQFPQENDKLEPLGMFFDKNWVVGKIVDRIASVGKLLNVNNTMDMPKVRFVMPLKTPAVTIVQWELGGSLADARDLGCFRHL